MVRVGFDELEALAQAVMKRLIDAEGCLIVQGLGEGLRLGWCWSQVQPAHHLTATVVAGETRETNHESVLN